MTWLLLWATEHRGITSGPSGRFFLAVASGLSTRMEPDDPIYDYVRTVMLEVMAVLWNNGQTHLHVGAMMRLIGVPESQAAPHDEERIDIQENLEAIDRLKKFNQAPSSATLH